LLRKINSADTEIGRWMTLPPPEATRSAERAS
jgi:hypothetical protein